MRLPVTPEIFYHPPKSSSFGHASVPRDPERGWQHTLGFLDELAVYSLRPRLELRIHCYPQWSDADLIERCLSEATEQFGEPTRSDGPLSKQWDVSSPLLAQAVAFALRDVSRPSQEIGPTWLSFSYDLWWKSHPALPTIERPGEGSSLGVIHGSRRLFLQPTLRFPFEEVSPEFKAFISHVQTHLPFRFREANFKVMFPSANARSSRVRKLPTGWLAA